ncbi:hypothetical protein ACFSUK_18495 [Sphingobium scionense]
MAASARDAETRRLGVATLTDMCARGRKRGIGTIIATQRLAKLASSVVSELHNHLIGLNVFDRDVARAADLLGFGSDQAALLRLLPPGEFFAFGPALSATPVLAKIDPTITPHIGRTPDLVAAADLGPDESRTLLDLENLREVAPVRTTHTAMRGSARSMPFCSTLPLPPPHALSVPWETLHLMPLRPTILPAILRLPPMMSTPDWICSLPSARPTRCRAGIRVLRVCRPGCACASSIRPSSVWSEGSAS